MEEKKRFKRYHWRVLNREMNIRYTLIFAGLIIFGFLLGGVITYLTIWDNLLILPVMQPEHFFIIRKKILYLLIVEFLLGGLPIVVLAIVFQFRFLHRAFGPLYRLEKAMQGIALGKLPEKPVVVREGDLLKELADSFNQSVSAIKSGKKFE